MAENFAEMDEEAAGVALDASLLIEPARERTAVDADPVGRCQIEGADEPRLATLRMVELHRDTLLASRANHASGRTT